MFSITPKGNYEYLVEGYVGERFYFVLGSFYWGQHHAEFESVDVLEDGQLISYGLYVRIPVYGLDESIKLKERLNHELSS